MNDNIERDPRLLAIPDTHGHAKGEHKPYADERPLPLTARMLFLWFYHACRRGYPRFLMVADHMNYLTFEDPAAVNLVRRALKLAQAGDLYGAAETANVDVGHAAVVSEGLRRGMRYSIGAEVDNDPRSRPDAQNIVDAMRPDAIIRSVHFVPITHPVHGEGWPWPFDNPEFADLFDVVGTEALWDTYIATLVDAIERLPGHIIGHFYVPALFGHWPDDAKLESYEDRVLEAAAVRGMAIEFNTRFLYRDHTDDEKRRYLDANKRLMRKARDRGVGISIGSDAHSPKDQGNAFETVLEVLDELEINEIVFPLAGLLRRVALRVVREPEPEPAPAPPPPPPEPARVRAPEPAAAEAAKPVRKARPAPNPVRAPERAESATPAAEAPSAESADASPAPRPPASVARPKRAPKDPAPPSAASQNGAAEPAAAAEPSAPPVVPAPSKAPPAVKAVVAAVRAVATAAKTAASKPAAPKAASPKAAPSKAAPSKSKPASVKPAASKVAARGAKAPAKAPGKAKPAARPAAKAKPPARKAAAKAPSRAGGKKAAPAKPVRKPAGKPVPAKKAAAKKPAAKKGPVKKAAPKKAAARGAVKRTAPAKKPAGKKSAPTRSAPARKPAAAKKTAKKTATKRR